MIVMMKDGRIGRIFNDKGLIGNKKPVYPSDEDGNLTGEKAILCCKEYLELIGFID